jgi:hypothetical protein
MRTQYDRKLSSTISSHQMLVPKKCGINAWLIFYDMSTEVLLFVTVTSHDPHRTASNHIHHLTARIRCVLISYITFLPLHSHSAAKTPNHFPFVRSFVFFFFRVPNRVPIRLHFSSLLLNFTWLKSDYRTKRRPKCTFTRKHSINAWAWTSHNNTPL